MLALLTCLPTLQSALLSLLARAVELGFFFARSLDWYRACGWRQISMDQMQANEQMDCEWMSKWTAQRGSEGVDSEWNTNGFFAISTNNSLRRNIGTNVNREKKTFTDQRECSIGSRPLLGSGSYWGTISCRTPRRNSIHPSIHLSVWPSVCLYIRLFAHLAIHF